MPLLLTRWLPFGKFTGCQARQPACAVTPDAGGVETIGGYRIIRRLGSGSRGDVYLGHAGQASRGEPRLAAIKVFQPQVPEETIDAEISALNRLNHPHITRMLDLATGLRNTPCLVLQRLEPGGLPRLLADRRELEPGEAVTILAPLVSAVSAMHAAGVVHGGLGTRAVLFDDAGAPVISGFGGAGSISVPGEAPVAAALLDDDPRVAGDRDALAALALSVLGHVRGDTTQVAELFDWLSSQQGSADACATLEQRLFALATPMPVQFSPSSREQSRADQVPHRLSVAEPSVRNERLSTVRDSRPSPGWVGQLALPPDIADWLGRQWAQAPDWLVTRAAALASAVRSVRRRVWVVAAIGLVAMASAVFITQQPVPEHDSTVAGGNEPAPTPSIPAQAVAPTAADSDDLVAVATALLELRAQCLHDRSILCLDAVHAPDSSSRRADASRIRSIEDGGELAPDPIAAVGEITVTDRMGDTALLTAVPAEPQGADTPPASVLMVRTEAGWRLRSLLAGSAPVDQF